MEFTINGKKVQAELSAYTFVVYEQEFGSDMLSDVLGKVEVDSDDNAIVDFTKTDWGHLTKAVWAMCKTANESIPNYKAWAKEAKGLRLFELNAQVGDAIADAFFLAGSEEGAEGEGGK